MKRIILYSLAVLVILTIAVAWVFAQSPLIPDGAKVQYAYKIGDMKKVNYSWTSTDTSGRQTDTIGVGATNFITYTFCAPDGYINLSLTAIMAATDSFRIVLFGNNSNLRDTLVSTRMDSVNYSSAGYKNWVPNVSGKWKPSLFLQFRKMGSTSTSYVKRVILGVQ